MLHTVTALHLTRSPPRKHTRPHGSHRRTAGCRRKGPRGFTTPRSLTIPGNLGRKTLSSLTTRRGLTTSRSRKSTDTLKLTSVLSGRSPAAPTLTAAQAPRAPVPAHPATSIVRPPQGLLLSARPPPQTKPSHTRASTRTSPRTSHTYQHEAPPL